jgi:hypothetical protein
VEIEEHEFDKSESDEIEDLSKDMRFVGIFVIAVSVLSIIGGSLEWGLDGNIVGGVWYIYSGILNIFIGVWTVNAATFFKLIAEDRGTDMKNLMAGVGEVRKVYELQRWFFIAWLILIIGWLILFFSKKVL